MHTYPVISLYTTTQKPDYSVDFRQHFPPLPNILLPTKTMNTTSTSTSKINQIKQSIVAGNV